MSEEQASGGGLFLPPRLEARIRAIVERDTLALKLWRQANPESRLRRFLRRALAEIRLVLGMPSFWVLIGMLGWMAAAVLMIERRAG